MHKAVWKEEAAISGGCRFRSLHSSAITPPCRHFGPKAHRVAAFARSPRRSHHDAVTHIHLHRYARGPCFGPDFAFLLLMFAALIALFYLVSVVVGIRLVTPDELPGHPSLWLPIL